MLDKRLYMKHSEYKSRNGEKLQRDETKRTLLVRHGISEAYRGKAAIYPEQVPLDPEGEQQARDLALWLPYNPSLIVYSPYIRTWQTARPTMERFPRTPWENWPEVREFTYLGPLAGVRSNQADRAFFRDEYWEKCNPNEDYDSKDGESFIEFVRRTKKALYKINKLKGISIVFTHGLFIRCVQGILEGWLTDYPDREQMRRFCEARSTSKIDFCSVHEIRDGRIEEISMSQAPLWKGSEEASGPFSYATWGASDTPLPALAGAH